MNLKIVLFRIPFSGFLFNLFLVNSYAFINNSTIFFLYLLFLNNFGN